MDGHIGVRMSFKESFEVDVCHQVLRGEIPAKLAALKINKSYWLIATIERLLALTFIAAAFNFMLLPFALLGSLFLFGILLFGLRLTYDFQGSANMFIYFGTTLISLFITTMYISYHLGCNQSRINQTRPSLI